MKPPVLTIPAKAYLAKFFYWKLATPKDSIVPLSSNHSMLRMIITLLSGYSYDRNPRAVDPERFNDRIRVRIRQYDYDSGYYHFSSDAVVQLSKYLRACFYEEIIDRIHRNEDRYMKNVIWDFMHELDIVDDIKHGTVKKATDRIRKEISTRQNESS